MKQFILGSDPDRDGRIRLEGSDYRHLVRARRLAPGECFPALLPGGGSVTVRVASVDSRVLVGEVFQGDPSQEGQPPDLPPIILFQALPKNEKMDLIVRQAAESGIAEIVPFTSEFSIVKTSSGSRLSRWERIIREARQQSGSAAATAIRQPVPMDGLFACWEEIKAQWPGALGLLFHHTPHTGVENKSLHGYLGEGYPEAVIIAIGPEGGFSPAEAERFVAAGFRPLTIGNTILRTETAALYAHAAVRILLLERASWEMT